MLSHHGTESVCALNDICIFGKSAAEDLEARLNLEPPVENTDMSTEPLADPLALPEVVKQMGENGSSQSALDVPKLLIDKEGSLNVQPGKETASLMTVTEGTKVVPPAQLCQSVPCIGILVES